MTGLVARVERAKLAHDLRVDAAEVGFLEVLEPAEVVELRHRVAAALYSPHEHRFGRLAKASSLVPPTIAAKVAQAALTPVVAARVAAVMDPAIAVKMSSHLDPAYLAEVTPHLDPSRVGDIVSGLPESLLVDVGRRMLVAGEWVALGRFISLISADASLQVVERATGLELLRISLFTDDLAALDAVVIGLSDEQLTAAVRAAEETGEVDDALTLLGALSPEVTARVVRVVETLDAELRDFLVRTAERRGFSA